MRNGKKIFFRLVVVVVILVGSLDLWEKMTIPVEHSRRLYGSARSSRLRHATGGEPGKFHEPLARSADCSLTDPVNDHLATMRSWSVVVVVVLASSS